MTKRSIGLASLTGTLLGTALTIGAIKKTGNEIVNLNKLTEEQINQALENNQSILNISNLTEEQLSEISEKYPHIADIHNLSRDQILLILENNPNLNITARAGDCLLNSAGFIEPADCSYQWKNIRGKQSLGLEEAERLLGNAGIYENLEIFGDDGMKKDVEDLEIKVAQIILDEIGKGKDDEFKNGRITNEVKMNIDRIVYLEINIFYERWLTKEQREQLGI